MDQCVRALALAEDPSLVPNPHIGWHTAGCNFSFREIRCIWCLTNILPKDIVYIHTIKNKS